MNKNNQSRFSITKDVMSPSNHVCQKIVGYFEFTFMKDYIHRLSTRELTDDQIRVIKIGVRSDRPPLVLHPVRVQNHDDTKVQTVSDHYFEATVLFGGYPYELVFTLMQDDIRGLRCEVSITALHEESSKPYGLFKYLRDTSVRYSQFKNKFLGFKPALFPRQVAVAVEEIEIAKSLLDEIFVSENIMDHVRLFIDSVKRYRDVGKTLRYLFSGKPGTAKTMLLRAIAHELRGHATILFTNGSDDRVDALFELARCLSPVIIIIDDLDLLIQTREITSKTEVIGKILQHLDGFVKNDMFLLATTNDKQIVDQAASRPGRFDAILDVGRIDITFYREFIRSKTDANGIVDLLDHQDIIDMLEARKVTGAFLANVIKRLELELKVRGKCMTLDETIELIKNMDRGFYKTKQNEESVAGFVVS